MDTSRPAIIPIKSAPENSPEPYLPHLAIYDHLPRNIDIFSDSSKYQKWARAVLPRIASPKRHHKGFMVQTSRSESAIHDTLPLSPDIVRINRHYKSDTCQIDTFPTYVANKKKVRPGLIKGSTVKTQHDKIERQEPSLAGKNTPVKSTASSPAWDRQFSTTPFKEAFHQMVINEEKRSYSSFQVRAPLKKHSKRREKTYVRISLPVQPNPLLVQQNPLLVPNPLPVQHTVLFENKKAATKPLKLGQTKLLGFNSKGNRLPSSLKSGFDVKKEKTIPSFHEMTRSLADDFGPLINTVKS